MTIPTKLSEIVNSIYNPPSNTTATIAMHLEGLKGPRLRGSTTTKGLDSLADRDLIPIDDKDKHLIGTGCIAWYVELTDKEIKAMKLRYGAMPLNEFSKETKIECRHGLHGWELVANGDMLVATSTPKRIYIIWSEEYNCVATWHPGLPCVQLPQNVGVKF